MNELWTPLPDKRPDVSNLFDMMMVFQEQLDSTEEYKSKYHAAQLAVDALATAVAHLKKRHSEITVVTGLALIDSTDEQDKLLLAKNIGLRGNIADIHCVELDGHVPLSLMLGMDVMSVFPRDDPDNGDYIMSTAKTPINQVHYIETLAS